MEPYYHRERSVSEPLSVSWDRSDGHSGSEVSDADKTAINKTIDEFAKSAFETKQGNTLKIPEGHLDCLSAPARQHWSKY